MQPGHMMVSLYCSEYLALSNSSSIFSQTTHQIFRCSGMRDICFEGLLTHSLASRSIGPTISSDRYSPRARTADHVHNATGNDDDYMISFLFLFVKDYQACARRSW